MASLASPCLAIWGANAGLSRWLLALGSGHLGSGAWPLALGLSLVLARSVNAVR
jgi:hypothetical protein